jgi:hypothetical protein
MSQNFSTDSITKFTLVHPVVEFVNEFAESRDFTLNLICYYKDQIYKIGQKTVKFLYSYCKGENCRIEQKNAPHKKIFLVSIVIRFFPWGTKQILCFHLLISLSHFVYFLNFKAHSQKPMEDKS